MSLTSKLLEKYKQRIESLQLIPAGGGAFELAVGDELVYSKLQTGEFPDEAAMIEEVGARLG